MADEKNPEFESVTIRKPGSKFSMHLLGFETGVGLWMECEGEKGPMVAVYNQADQMCIGVYPREEGKVSKNNGIACGLCVDNDGVGYIQMVDKEGKARNFTTEDVLRTGVSGLLPPTPLGAKQPK